MIATTHYESPEVEHAYNCHRVDCCIQNPSGHFSCYYFNTPTDIYVARSLQKAAEMWFTLGKGVNLVDVGRIG